jgi:hypothetical protein
MAQMDENFKLRLDLAHVIAAEIQTLTDEFDVDAASRVAERRKQALAELKQDPRFQSIAREVQKDRLALLEQRRTVAQKLQSNGVTENLGAFEYWLWDSRLVDKLTVDLRRDEKVIEVKPFAVVTNQRVRSRSELKQACRYVTELNDTMFERQFTSDQAVREVEARHNQQPASPGGRGSVSNSDWPRR